MLISYLKLQGSYKMKIQLSDETVSALEDISGKKITRNGDKVIREVCEMVEKENGIDVLVCDQTEKMAGDEK